ncbi:MAG: hypothetical protein IJS94_07775 [Clostridia bacterium]|nr:hypothetical protein [Clostridia bacterium]
MKKIIAFLLVAMFLVSALAVSTARPARAEDLKDGDLLYECDFSNGLPSDFRIITGDTSRVKVEGGFLYLDAQGVEFVRVLLPQSLDKYGNYEITIHATILNARDDARWGSVTYRTQNANYPYYQMCFRKNTTASNGVEFALRTESNTWSVTSTGSYEKRMSESELFELSVFVRDDHAIHSVNGTPVVDCYDAGKYSAGGIGLQANYSMLKVDDIRVTYLKSANTSGLSNFVEIAQPDTGVIGGYAFSEYVTDQASLDRLTQADIKPAIAIFYVDSGLKLTGADGKSAFTDLGTALEKLGGSVMPALYVKTEAASAAVCRYLSKNAISDVFIMSSEDNIVLKARTEYTLCRGVLDLTEELKAKTLSDADLLSIRGRANSSHASIVVLPDTAATQHNVKYIYDRLVAVWVASTSPVTTAAQAFAILSYGGYGAITDNTKLMYKTATEKMSGNKLFRTPLNIGHRGIPSQAPENTLEGCRLAYQLGADVVENDIYLTKDGYIVIMHDSTTNRTCNGNLSVENSTLAELRQLYVNKQFPDKEGFTHCRIPTLEEYYQEFKGKDIQIFVEIKGSSEALIQKFTQLTAQYGMEGQVSVITFNENQIKNLHNHFPTMSAGYLTSSLFSGDTATKQVQNVLKKVQTLSSTYNPSFSGHTADFVYNANMRGLLTWPWTINDSTYHKNFFMWGYNGLTTNYCTYPAEYAKLLTSKQSAYTIDEGQTLTVEAEMTTYERKKTDVSKAVRVIPLSGNMTVGQNNVLYFEDAGEYTYALEYAFKKGDVEYTIYTEPVNVTVKSGIPSRITFKSGTGFKRDFGSEFATPLGTGKTVGDIKSAIPGADISVFSGDQALDDSVKLATGMVVKIYVEGTETDSAIIAVRGDVDCDGEITSNDHVEVKAYFKASVSLDKAALEAADADGNGKITASDYIMIKRHNKGTIDLFA